MGLSERAQVGLSATAYVRFPAGSCRPAASHPAPGTGRWRAAARLGHRRSVKARRGTLARAGLGFLCGVVFWHVVGFWSFLDEVVLNGPVLSAEAGVAPPLQMSAPAGCIALALDRVNGTTRQVGCRADAPAAPAQQAQPAGGRDESIAVRSARPEAAAAIQDGSRLDIAASQQSAGADLDH